MSIIDVPVTLYDSEYECEEAFHDTEISYEFLLQWIGLLIAPQDLLC